MAITGVLPVEAKVMGYIMVQSDKKNENYKKKTEK